jgi:CO/xanthine dehydrogenase Mo-binding subunit
MDAPRLTRREFTAALGGIVLSFSLVPRVVFGQDPARLPGSLQTNRTLDAWLRINADGSVTVFTGKVELGQGIVTALAQIAAEELEVPLARVTMISGDTGRTPNEGQTAGSQSIEQSGTALRMAGAEVRALLIGLPSGSSASPLTRSRSRMASSMRPTAARSATVSSLQKRTSSARQPARCRRSRPHSIRSSASPCRASTSRPR